MNGTLKGAVAMGLLAGLSLLMLLTTVYARPALVGVALFGVLAIILCVVGSKKGEPRGRVLRTLETKNRETTIITPDTNMLISYCNPVEKTHRDAKKFINKWMGEKMMYVTDTALAEVSGHPMRERMGRRYDENLKKILDYCGVGMDPVRKRERNFDEIPEKDGRKTDLVRRMVPRINAMYRAILEDKSMQSNVNMWCVRKKQDRDQLVNEKRNRSDRAILAEAALLADANYDRRVTLVSMDGDFTLFPIPIRNEFGVMAIDGYELFRRG